MRRAEVHAPFEFEQFLLFRVCLFFVEIEQIFCRIIIGHARERRLDVLQLGNIPPEEFQLRGTIAQHGLHDMGDQTFLHFHQSVQIAEGDLRFEHPELGEVAACL